MKTYDLKHVKITFGGLEIAGFGEETISYERTELSSDRSGRVSFSVTTTPQNRAALEQLMNYEPAATRERWYQQHSAARMIRRLFPDVWQRSPIVTGKDGGKIMQALRMALNIPEVVT